MSQPILPNPKPKRQRTWSPSPREQAIYQAVAVLGRTQEEAGREFGRSQSAVSRLLRRFERWRGGARPEVSGDLDATRQKHLDRWLARQRQEEIYRRSMRLATKMEDAPAKTHREGARDGKQWHEDVQRDQLAAAGQMLKTALRASEALEKLTDKPPLPRLPEGDPEVDERRLFSDLRRLREEAEEAGTVPKSRDIYWTIHHWKNALVGERPGFSLPSETAPGSVRAELARTIMGEGSGQSAVGSGEAAKGSGEATVGSEVTVVESLPASAIPQSEIRNPPSPCPPKTHKRIVHGGHPPLEPKEPASGATSERLTPCRQPPGCGRIVMIDPSTGKKYGAPADDYGDDPLSLLYRRVEERMRREAGG